MKPCPAVSVEIDLTQIRRNAEGIIARTGVALIPVLKADAYGLGASEIARTLADLASGFYFFDAAEVFTAQLRQITDCRALCLFGSSEDPDDYRSARIQPLAWTADRARTLRRAGPIVMLDTGQQRFSCAANDLREITRAGESHEIMTHANTLEQARFFRATITDQLSDQKQLFLHAAGSALLDQPQAWLNAVRPGLALYTNAVHVTAPLIEVKDSNGPAGYTGFNVARFGVILIGYRHGLRPGPCIINEKPQRILEVGMQSAFVEISRTDKVGDPVTLLGNGLEIGDIAKAWSARPQEVLINLVTAGERTYRTPASALR